MSGLPSSVESAKLATKSLKSMTGYAQAERVEHGFSMRVSVRSVNHRFLDLHVRVPEGFEPLEPRIRHVVRERVRRGHLDVTLRYEPAGPAAFVINEQVAAAYIQALNGLRKQFGIQAEADLTSVLRLPGVIALPATTLDGELDKLDDILTGCLGEALDKLDRMRGHEGDALRREMLGRLARITDLVARVHPLAERAGPAFAKRLETRLQELLAETQLDPVRITQEAAMVAERSDISEELTRLASHVRQFESVLSTALDAGKKLDFLLQEMQREANTMLSKTPGHEAEGLEITTLGLEIKSEIEKLREQVQNIE
ncbi:MAG TPA: YicC/YloC family endoribonuclease [Candidatus Acidoferrales bacterium]|nr:YicC/YloC family endoribonuclease [Candidatus Acidoferrales bacterium]